MFQSNRAAHATGSAASSTRAQHSDPALERLIRRAYWPDYAVLAALGVAAPQTRGAVTDGAASTTGGLADHLLHEALADHPLAPDGLGPGSGLTTSGLPSGLLSGASLAGQGRGAFRPGPFGGAAGDGVSRNRGSHAVQPPPPVVPAYAFRAEPARGERWDLQALIEGFGPAYGP